MLAAPHLSRCLLISILSCQLCPPSFAEQAPGASLVTLCSASETAVFSCRLGRKTVSLCISRKPSTSDSKLIYRYGIPGTAPELVYPNESRGASNAFSFTTIGGPTWVISFHNGKADYDVMSDLKASSLPQYKFTGIGVTVDGGQTTLRPCNSGPVVMDLQPLNGYFPEYMPPKHAPSKPPFEVISKSIDHGATWTSTVAYPLVGDPALDQEIQKFAKDCYSDDFGPNGHCSQTVSAELIKDRFLVLTFDSFEYATGQPHGDEEMNWKTYMKNNTQWVRIKKNSLIANTDTCKKRYAALINRRVRPELTSEYADKVAPHFADLFDEAEQVLTVDGVMFTYGQYALGPRVSPQGVLVTFDGLGACFAPQVDDNPTD